MCTYIKNFSACRYIVLTASAKLHIGSPKMARNEQVCAHQKVTSGAPVYMCMLKRRAGINADMLNIEAIIHRIL